MRGILYHLMSSGITNAPEYAIGEIARRLAGDPIIDCGGMSDYLDPLDRDYAARPKYRISIPSNTFLLEWERYAGFFTFHNGLEDSFDYIKETYGADKARRFASSYALTGGRGLLSVLAVAMADTGELIAIDGMAHVAVYRGESCQEPDGEDDNHAYVVLRQGIKALSVLGGGGRMSPFAGQHKKRAIRQGATRWGSDPLAWKRYRIEIPNPVSRGGGWVAIRDAARSPHLVRGSHATYSRQKPLFGKYSGTFYRPPHIRA